MWNHYLRQLKLNHQKIIDMGQHKRANMCAHVTNVIQSVNDSTEKQLYPDNDNYYFSDLEQCHQFSDLVKQTDIPVDISQVIPKKYIYDSPLVMDVIDIDLPLSAISVYVDHDNLDNPIIRFKHNKKNY